MGTSAPVQTNGYKKRRTSIYNCRLLQLEGWNSRNEDSTSHKEAMEVMVIIPSSCPYVAEMLSKEHAAQRKENRQCLLKILSNLHFLGRQGIALRGDGNESDSNFVQLLKLYGNDDPRIETCLQCKMDKYISRGGEALATLHDSLNLYGATYEVVMH